jgi:hypothetical protein
MFRASHFSASVLYIRVPHIRKHCAAITFDIRDNFLTPCDHSLNIEFLPQYFAFVHMLTSPTHTERHERVNVQTLK